MTDEYSLTLINCRSLRCNIDIILRYLIDNDIHIAAFTETWLNDDDHHILSLLNQFSFSGHCYTYFASNRISSNRLSSSHGGGVGCLIRNTFKMSSYKCIPFSLSDGLIVSIKNGTSLFNLVIIYRLPINDYTTFLMSFLTFLLISIYQILLL